MSSVTRSPARRDEMTAVWFDGLRAGRLLLRSCPQGHCSRPDAFACDVCGSLELGWAEAAGRGNTVALAVDHSTDPPTQLVVVQLDEGPWLITRHEGEQVARGADVVVNYVQDGEGETYPVVSERPAGSD